MGPTFGYPFSFTVCSFFIFCSIAIFAFSPSLSMDGPNGQKKTKTVDFEVLTKEQLCVLCQAVLSRWKGQMNTNEQHFKEELLTSCSLVENPEEAKKCRDGVSDAKMARLSKEGSEEICVSEGFCGKGELKELEKKMDRMEKRIDARKQKFEKGLRIIPPVILSPEKSVQVQNNATNLTNGI